MAIIIYILVGLCFVAGLVLFIGNAPTKTKDRDAFLVELTKFIDGKLDKIEGTQEDYRITFTVQNKELKFEDCKIVGFEGQVNTGFLKIKTDSKLILSFSERKRRTRLKGDVFLASKVSNEPKDAKQNLKIPDILNMFEVHTNDIFATNQLLNDPKMGRIFLEFKNIDQRGYPFMALKVIDGELIFQFQTLSRYKPSLMSLMDNIALMEDYAQKAIIIAGKIDQIALSDY